METGIRYTVGHVWKILRRLGCSWHDREASRVRYLIEIFEDDLAGSAKVELPRFRGHLSVWGEMIAREVSNAEDATALPAGLP
jgi:hypothetical protein